MNIEIWKDDQILMRGPASAVAPDTSGVASMLASLSISKFPAGEYEARVRSTTRGKR